LAALAVNALFLAKRAGPYATIAALLNADAIPSASGKPHTADSVKKALKAARRE
jgi:hypothetical protein